MLKKNSVADLVASNMAEIVESDEYRAIFSKPKPPTKTASEDVAEKVEPPKKLSKAERLNRSMQALCKVSEILDDLGLERSAFMTLRTLDNIVVEAGYAEDMGYSKDKKDKDEEDDDKKDEKDDKKKKDEDEEEDNNDAKDKKKDDEKEDKEDKEEKEEDDKKEDDENDANTDPLKEVSERMDYERTGLGPEGTIQHGKPQETIPAPPGSGYERIPAADQQKVDLFPGKAPGEGTGAGQRDTLPTRRQHPPQYNPQKVPGAGYSKPEGEKSKGGETYGYEENMASDSAIDVGLGNVEGYGDTGNASDKDYAKIEAGGEELRELLEDLGVATKEANWAEDFDLKTIAEMQNYLSKVAAKKKDKKWIQKAVKKPGRFEGWSLSKMKKRYNELKDKKDKSKSENSEMRALALGIRMKGGDVPGGKKKKGL